MLSTQKIKFIKSLQIKKYRNIHSRFLVEGTKNVLELLQSSYQPELLVVSDGFMKEYDYLIKDKTLEVIPVKTEKLESISALKSNNSALAVVEIPQLNKLVIDNDVILILDDIRDPGNLGTIIRTADWFGIKKIVASSETADMYNPKVIQASMGSFTRVDLYYDDLDNFFQSYPDLFISGAVFNGKPVHQMTIHKPMGILFGNESKGINSKFERYLNERVTISKFGRAESLNVAMSVAIICDNLRRLQPNLH